MVELYRTVKTSVVPMVDLIQQDTVFEIAKQKIKADVKREE